MSRRRFLVCLGVTLASACSTEKPVATPHEIKAHLEAAGCWPSPEESERVFDELTALVRSRLNRPERALVALDRVSKELDSANLDLQAHRLGERGIAMLSEIGCGGEVAAARLTSLLDGPSGWRVGGVRRLDASARHEVLASSDRRSLLVVLESTTGTQAEQGTLQVFDDRLRLVEDHAGVIDPLTTRHAGASVVRWKERYRHLATPLDSPYMRRVEAVIDVERSPVISMVSEMPWIDALDDSCRARNTFACGGTVTDVRAEAGEYSIAVRDADRMMRCDAAPGAPTLDLAADRSAVVTVVRASERWQVQSVRPGDRRCAIYGERTPASLDLAPDVESFEPMDRPRALASDGHAVVIATAEHVGWLGHPSERPIWVDGPRDVAFIQGTPTWIDVEGKVTRASGNRTQVIVDDSGAAALASCDGAVCWTDYEAGVIRRRDRRGVTTIANGLSGPLGLASGSGVLFVATDDGLVAVQKGTGATEQREGALSPLYVAFKDDVLAWTEADGRVLVQAEGSATRLLQRGGRPSSIAIADGFVYWIDVEAATVRRAPLPARSAMSASPRP